VCPALIIHHLLTEYRHRREQRKAEQDEKNALTAKVEGLDNTVKKVVADNSKIIAVLNQQRARCAQPSGVVLQRHMAALTEHRRKAEAARARDEQYVCISPGYTLRLLT